MVWRAARVHFTDASVPRWPVVWRAARQADGGRRLSLQQPDAVVEFIVISKRSSL
jgi:hypothetical protein